MIGTHFGLLLHHVLRMFCHVDVWFPHSLLGFFTENRRIKERRGGKPLRYPLSGGKFAQQAAVHLRAKYVIEHLSLD